MPLDGPRTRGGARRGRRSARSPPTGIGGLAALDAVRRGAGAGLHLDRPPALPVLHPVRADRGQLAVRPRRRRLRRSTAAPGWRAPERSTPRTRRCAGSPTWPACPRRPAASSCPAARSATCRPSSPARHAARASRRRRPAGRGWKVAGTVQRALLDQVAPARSWTPTSSASRSTTTGRLTGADLREALEADGADGLLRRRRDRRHDQLRHRRRPRLGRRGLPRVRRLVPRRRRLRRRRPGRAVRAPPVRRHRARRLVHRRPAQVALRAVRLLRPALPRAGAGAGRRTPRRPATSTSSPTRRDWNPTDYSIGLTRRARGLPFWFSLATHGTRRLHRGDRADAGGDPLRGGRDRAAPLRRAAARAGPVGRRLPPDRLDRRRTTRSGRDRLLADQIRLRRARPRTRARRSPGSRSSTRSTTEDDINAILDTMA